MAPKIRSIATGKTAILRSANEDGLFYPGEIAALLKSWGLDYRQLRKLVEAVSPKRVSSKRQWLRISYLELRGVKEALRLASEIYSSKNADSQTRKRRLPLGLFRDSSLFLSDLSGFPVPFASLQLQVDGGCIVVKLGDAKFDLPSGQLHLKLDSQLQASVRELRAGTEFEKRTADKLKVAVGESSARSTRKIVPKGFELPLTRALVKRGG